VSESNVIDLAPVLSLRTEGATKVFGRNSAALVAVKPLDIEFTTRSAVGIVGESGSGKSTLSRMLVGLDKPTAGRVLLGDADVAALTAKIPSARDFRRTVQYVAQDTSSSFDPRRTLRDAVMTPLRLLRGITGGEAEAEVAEILALLRLNPAHIDRYPHEVSGGQRQRFSLARALVVRPRFLVCDEVVSALDVSVQGAVLNTVKAYCQEHSVGLIFVSHGLPATAFISRHLVVMRHGEVVEYGPTGDVITSPRHPYTASLLDAYLRGPRHLIALGGQA
jgi:ABC-type glutathione transport system ATPase component